MSNASYRTQGEYSTRPRSECPFGPRAHSPFSILHSSFRRPALIDRTKAHNFLGVAEVPEAPGVVRDTVEDVEVPARQLGREATFHQLRAVAVAEPGRGLPPALLLVGEVKPEGGRRGNRRGR